MPTVSNCISCARYTIVSTYKDVLHSCKISIRRFSAAKDIDGIKASFSTSKAFLQMAVLYGCKSDGTET
ncbi:hypothetical protein CEXT_315891, partial [Caerostris extrusa]